jgi:PAS domain S-box-containing protein
MLAHSEAKPPPPKRATVGVMLRPPASSDDADLHELVLESIDEGVFTVDAEFHVTSFNAAAERITGLPRASAIGRRCYEVFRSSICQGECAMKRTLRTGEPVRNVRVDILDANMRTVPIRVSTGTLKRGGTLVGGVEVFRDISDIETLREKLRGERGEIIGTSPLMQAALKLLPDVAVANAAVLVEGPSGTGKELVARAIHQLSPRARHPFIQINCAALPDSLLESELFGYTKGAFTGATRDKPGRFRLAEGGTLFLDEIGDISPAFQGKLLRVLQSGEFEPLGATRTEHADVRIIAATHRDLAALVREGKFREDLYYRIRVVPISLPALKDRRGDVPLLVDHFVRKLAAVSGKSIRDVSPEVMALMCRYEFPGNVRELENGLERAFVLCQGISILPEHLPPEWQQPVEALRIAPELPAITVPPSEDPQRIQLEAALASCQWNRTETAKMLGIGRNTLWRRMKALGILSSPSGETIEIGEEGEES